MNYMLDTNICIYLIKHKPAKVLKKFKSISPDEICLSSVTLAELSYGVEKSQQREKNQIALEAFTLAMDIVSFDENASSCYGEIRAYLEKKGKIIGPLDLMIAAHAISLNSMLVTNNEKEFSRVPQLKVGNWANI